MTEQEYDEQIAPALAELARKINGMGGSIIARVEWSRDEAGITQMGVNDQSGIGQRLAQIAVLCQGNFDSLYLAAAKRFDMSKTIVGSIMARSE